MAHAHHVVRIDRLAEIVFDFLAEGANNPSWQWRVLETTRVGGPVREGTTYRQSMRHPLGFKVSTDYVLTAFERPRTLSFQATSGGPLRPQGTFDLTPVDSGTTDVRYSLRYRPRGLGWLAAPFLPIAGLLFRRQTSSLGKAKEVIEAR